MKYIVLDIGGSSVKYALIDDQLKRICNGSKPCSTDSMEGLLDPIRKIKEEIQDEYDGVAVSMPGRIDTKQGIAYTGGAFTFINQDHMEKRLQEIFEKPVTIANDGKCAANAELAYGALRGADSGAVLILGTGIGGGIIMNGKVWMGHSFGAGEFSTLPTSFDEFNRFEVGTDDIASFPQWARDFSTRGLVHTYCRKKGIIDTEGYDGRKFFEAYDAHDAEAIEVFSKFCQGLAIGIYSIQAIVDVERIAIGGGISARPEVAEGIRKAVDNLFDRLIGCPFNRPEIVPCDYGNNANLLGALRFHLERVITD